MKKQILLTMALAVATSVALTSCSDPESEGMSRITYYPTIDLKGESTVFVIKGSSASWADSDPGYTSMMGSEDVTDQVNVNSNVDMNTGGVYTVTYTTVKNPDGFSSSVSRTVYVWDPSNGIDGYYTNQPTSYRVYNGNEVLSGGEYPILIIKMSGEKVYVDDFFGGWYSQRAGYGDRYKMGGVMTLAADGSLSLVSSLVPGWGDGLDDLSGTYDAASNTFNVTAVYNGGTMFFNQTWVKQ